MEGILVVAVCTKKDYMAVPLLENPLTDSCWVQLHKKSQYHLSLYSTLQSGYTVRVKPDRMPVNISKTSDTLFGLKMSHLYT